MVKTFRVYAEIRELPNKFHILYDGKAVVDSRCFLYLLVIYSCLFPVSTLVRLSILSRT